MPTAGEVTVTRAAVAVTTNARQFTMNLNLVGTKECQQDHLSRLVRVRQGTPGWVKGRGQPPPVELCQVLLLVLGNFSGAPRCRLTTAASLWAPPSTRSRVSFGWLKLSVPAACL